jgi:hypothetical protein
MFSDSTVNSFSQQSEATHMFPFPINPATIHALKKIGVVFYNVQGKESSNINGLSECQYYIAIRASCNSSIEA